MARVRNGYLKLTLEAIVHEDDEQSATELIHEFASKMRVDMDYRVDIDCDVDFATDEDAEAFSHRFGASTK